MGVSIKHDWAFKALQNTGYIGAFKVDYKDQSIRGNGKTGSYFWLLKKQMAEGISLHDLNRAYHPDDLERILEMRAGFIGRGGQYENSFRVKNPFSDGYAHVRASFTVVVDPFGIPVSAVGAFFDVTSVVRERARPMGSVVSLAGYLKDRNGSLNGGI